MRTAPCSPTPHALVMNTALVCLSTYWSKNRIFNLWNRVFFFFFFWIDQQMHIISLLVPGKMQPCDFLLFFREQSSLLPCLIVLAVEWPLSFCLLRAFEKLPDENVFVLPKARSSVGMKWENSVGGSVGRGAWPSRGCTQGGSLAHHIHEMLVVSAAVCSPEASIAVDETRPRQTESFSHTAAMANVFVC